MENRYLFKAKRIDNGEWIVGNLLTIVEISSFICTGKIKLDGALKGHIYPEIYAVDESTICQCTGLKDGNGTLIWENDLVLTPKEDGYSLTCWNDTEARWEIHNETEGIVLDFDNYWSNEIEVCGNKFDNLELLEVE